jgi:pyruvate dehydrogenase (quinone)
VCGIPGDSLNGFSDALRRDGGIAWQHVRHEEAAAFAAATRTILSGEGAELIELAKSNLRDLEAE